MAAYLQTQTSLELVFAQRSTRETFPALNNGPALVVLMDRKVTFKELRRTQREAAIDYRSFIRIRDPRFRHRTNFYARTKQLPCYNRPSS
jgi:hypothetical protein